MEKWDLYTEYREKTGKEQVRGKAIPEGFYHEVSDCRWMTVSEIRKLYEENQLVQTLEYFFRDVEAEQTSNP